MSYVTFGSPSGSVDLYGTERHWAGGLISDLTIGVLDVERNSARLRELISPDHYLSPQRGLLQGSGWVSAYQTAFRVGSDYGAALISWRGQDLSAFTLSLNTAWVIGSDPVRFLTRLHGQSELHGWVDGPNRAWLAGIIDAGLASGVYRAGLAYGSDRRVGWEGVSGFLRSSNAEPVVMSASQGSTFPYSTTSDWMPPWPDDVPKGDWAALGEERAAAREARDEAWYDLPEGEQWVRGLAWLRAQDGMLELLPQGWEGYRYSHGLTVLDILSPDYAARLDAATPQTAATA